MWFISKPQQKRHMDIHNYKRRLEKTLSNIGESAISESNKLAILDFHDSCLTEGMSICKIERYLYDLHRFALMLKSDLKAATQKDIQRIAAEIEKKEWTAQSKLTFKMMIRKFYKWVDGIYERGGCSERVKWLKCTAKNGLKLPEELLTEDEIKSMINGCENSRNRALIAALYESGCRVGEIGSMKMKNISFDEYGMKVIVSGKTGSRMVRLINSVPYIQAWLNEYPFNKNPDSFVWVKGNGHPMTYTRMSSIIKDIAKRAGIKKRIYPHLFRHSRATYLAKHLTEAQMKDYLGWTQSSKMAAIYVHLSGRDTDMAILKLNGVKVEQEKNQNALKPKECPRCKNSNEATNMFCKICGMVLDEQAKLELMKKDLQREKADNFMDSLMNDEEFKVLIKKKLQERAGQLQPAHP